VFLPSYQILVGSIIGEEFPVSRWEYTKFAIGLKEIIADLARQFQSLLGQEKMCR